MMRGLTLAAALLLLVHGLIHLMGMTVYMRLGEIDGMEYKTTLLDGRWNLGSRGILVYGALWGIAAVGFTAAAAGWMVGWEPWRAVLVWGLAAALYLIAFYQRVAPAVITKELSAAFGLSAASLGNLSAFYFYGYVAVQIPTGLLADRFGPRRLMTAAPSLPRCSVIAIERTRTTER